MVTYMIPCLLGLEKLVADEVKRLGLQDVQAENGRILCHGTMADCARLNINLRCGARVMLVLGQFPARTFEELFQGVRAIPWEDYLPRDAVFPVKGYAISSRLHAVSACQSIIKKAMVERMKTAYGLEQFPETGVKHQVRFSIFKDEEHKECFTGFNPFKIDPALTGKELATTITAQASNFATVVQSIYDQSGVSDPYFSSLNETVTVSIAELLMLTYHLVHPGQVPKASDVQNLINDCSRCRPYLDALIKHYSVHSVRDSGNDRTEQVAEVVDVGQWQQVYTTINNDLLGENKANMYDRCNCLRNLINNFLNDPLVRDVFEAEETVDIDKALEYGEILILNYALERGDSVATGFGLFFLLSYETAVLRRPGSENDRIKNFIYIDELPVLLHPKLQSFFTLFRQYRVAVICAIQTLDQVKKIQLDSIMLGNCAHQIIFGRVSTTEMDIFSKMAGETLEHVTQETVTETAITAELPAYSYSRRSTPTLSERFSGTVFRYLGFQEVIFFSVNNSSPIYPFRGKVNFLPKPREKSAPRLKIEWEPFMPGPLHPSVFEKRFSVAHISSNGYFSSGKPGNYFLAGNKKSIPEPQVQTDLTTETTEAVSDAEDQTPVEPTHIITPTEHTDGIFFGE